MNPRFTALVERAGLVDADLDRLAEVIALDYPADPMMQELRLVRSLHVLAERRLTLAEMLDEMAADQRQRATSATRLTKT